MGKYKHGKPNQEIDLEDFKEALEKSTLNVYYKAYLVLLFWLGCRRSEPMFIKKEDVKITKDALYITITVDHEIPYSRLKHGKAGGPIELPLSLYGVDLIRKCWRYTPEGEFLFPFSDKTGYRIVKRLYPKRTPHWFRHNRLTKLRAKRDLGEISTDDIKSFSGIRTDKMVEHYGMQTREGIHKVAGVLD